MDIIANWKRLVLKYRRHKAHSEGFLHLFAGLFIYHVKMGFYFTKCAKIVLCQTYQMARFGVEQIEQIVDCRKWISKSRQPI